MRGVYVTSMESLSYAIFWLFASMGPFTPATIMVSPVRGRIIIRIFYQQNCCHSNGCDVYYIPCINIVEPSDLDNKLISQFIGLNTQSISVSSSTILFKLYRFSASNKIGGITTRTRLERQTGYNHVINRVINFELSIKKIAHLAIARH